MEYTTKGKEHKFTSRHSFRLGCPDNKLITSVFSYTVYNQQTSKSSVSGRTYINTSTWHKKTRTKTKSEIARCRLAISRRTYQSNNQLAIEYSYSHCVGANTICVRFINCRKMISVTKVCSSQLLYTAPFAMCIFPFSTGRVIC